MSERTFNSKAVLPTRGSDTSLQPELPTQLGPSAADELRQLRREPGFAEFADELRKLGMPLAFERLDRDDIRDLRRIFEAREELLAAPVKELLGEYKKHFPGFAKGEFQDFFRLAVALPAGLPTEPIDDALLERNRAHLQRIKDLAEVLKDYRIPVKESDVYDLSRAVDATRNDNKVVGQDNEKVSVTEFLARDDVKAAWKSHSVLFGPIRGILSAGEFVNPSIGFPGITAEVDRLLGPGKTINEKIAVAEAFLKVFGTSLKAQRVYQLGDLRRAGLDVETLSDLAESADFSQFLKRVQSDLPGRSINDSMFRISQLAGLFAGKSEREPDVEPIAAFFTLNKALDSFLASRAQKPVDFEFDIRRAAEKVSLLNSVRPYPQVVVDPNEPRRLFTEVSGAASPYVTEAAEFARDRSPEVGDLLRAVTSSWRLDKVPLRELVPLLSSANEETRTFLLSAENASKVASIAREFGLAKDTDPLLPNGQMMEFARYFRPVVENFAYLNGNSRLFQYFKNELIGTPGLSLTLAHFSRVAENNVWRTPELFERSARVLMDRYGMSADYVSSALGNKELTESFLSWLESTEIRAAVEEKKKELREGSSSGESPEANNYLLVRAIRAVRAEQGQ